MEESTFLAVCGVVLVFILAEGEIAREIMSFPQFVLSLESKAIAAAGAASLGASGRRPGAGPPIPPPCNPGPRVQQLEETTDGPLLLSLSLVQVESIGETKPLRN